MPKHPEVDRWMAAYDNPMKDVVQAVRDTVLAADPRVDECIKWQAPTFTYRGNIASFFPKSKQHASLMFHQGAKIPGKHARLEGTGDTARAMKFRSVAEVKKDKTALQAVVKAWIAWQDGTPGSTGQLASEKKAAAKEATAKKAAAKKAAAKKAAAKKAAAKKAAAKKTAAGKDKSAARKATTNKAVKKKAASKKRTNS